MVSLWWKKRGNELGLELENDGFRRGEAVTLWVYVVLWIVTS